MRDGLRDRTRLGGFSKLASNRDWRTCRMRNDCDERPVGVTSWHADDDCGPDFGRHAEIHQPDLATTSNCHSLDSRRSSSTHS